MAFRRMLPFILINVLVAAAVVFGILFWWDSREERTPLVLPATAVAITASAVPIESITQEQPEPTAAPEPESSIPIHVVRSGDTLMTISQFYDVPMDDIITINGIANPNILSVGQELLIPVGGIPTPTPPPVPTSEPAAIPSPNPTIPPESEGEVELQIANVFGVGNLTEEAVQIVNLGSLQVGLRDWKLRGEDGNEYTFPLFTLYGAGSGVLIHTETGENSATDLHWGLEQPIWQSGDQVTLLDATGTIRATFIIP